MGDAILTALSTFGVPGALIALIALGIRSIIKGDLMPGSTHRAIVASYQERLADSKDEAAQWRSAHDHSEAARTLLLDQVAQMTEFMKTSEHLLRSLPRVAGDQ